ncbi:PQQ-binding-like beta-propeller repeat protein [Streptomyces termitum]|uniref:Pyrrolo-quinoline quinone repeat domain-containing protein n=1 Tax=Streptomyces termitum TaxID=67368 RepID=A0A918T488_9ACTN|nr:PQQ-binding-like beta-propeller repeat protein [Streptomyces termitum]GHA92594.1 hypothetical protein GCM10010305_40390 [Streptomyces termitum]
MSYTPPSWYPPGSAPKPPRRRRDHRWTLLALGLALLVAAVSGTGWYLRGHDRPPAAAPPGTPAPGTSATTPAPGPPAVRSPTPVRVPGAEELADARRPGEAAVWIADDTTDLPRRTIPVHTPWLVGGTVVQALYRELTAYRVEDGTEAWNLPLPTPVCEAPVNPAPDGRIVLVLRSSDAERGAKCDRLLMVDLKNGKPGWSKELRQTGTRDDTFLTHVAISGDTLAVVQSMVATAYRVSDGSRLFGIPTEEPGRCHPDKVAGGARLLVSATCGLDVDRRKTSHQLRELDPRTGAVRWRHRTEPGRKIERVISVDPVVYTLLDVDRLADDWRIVALGPRGEVRRTIDARPKGFTHCADAGIDADLQPCPGAFVAHGQVHLGGTDRVGSYDLTTGKLVQGVKADGGRRLYPVHAESPKALVAYESATPSSPGRLFRLDPSGAAGTKKDLLRLPAASAAVEYGTMAGRILYADGRLLLAPSSVSGDDVLHQPRVVSFAPAPN